MNKNMLAVVPHLMARLGELDGVHSVQGVRELAQMLDDKTRQIIPEDNAVYVVFDSFTPEGSGNGKQKQVRLSFSIVLARQFYGASDVPHLESAVGEMLSAIRTHLQGWSPTRQEYGKDKPFLTQPFDEVAAAEIAYFDNFALYPVRFETVTL